MRLALPPVVSRPLTRGHGGLVGMEGQTLDVLGVGEVVALALLLRVVQHHHAGHEVDHLALEQLLLDILYFTQLLISFQVSENAQTKTNYIVSVSGNFHKHEV